METIAKPDVKVTIEGNDVTRDLSPYLVSLQYRDSTKPMSDSVDLYLTAQDDRFANDWYPPKGSKLEVSLGYAGDLVSTGTFDIDEVEHEGLPYRTTIRGIAALVTKGLRTKRTTYYENVTMAEIIRDVASRHGLRVLGNIDPRLVLERIAQDRETDIAFCSRLAETYGYSFSVRGDLLYYSDVYELESQAPVITVDIKDVERFSFRDQTMKIKRAAKTRYVNPDSQTNDVENADPANLVVRQYLPTPYAPLYQPFFNKFELVPADDPLSLSQGQGALNGVPFPSDGVTELDPPYVDDADFAFVRLDQAVGAEPADVPGGAVNGVPFPSDGVTGKHPPYNEVARFIFHQPPEVNGTDEDEEYLFGGARSSAEAAAMSKASMHKTRSAQMTGTLNMPGRPTMLAGSSILLTGFGAKFDGKYFIEESTHDVGPGGYNTQVNLKKV